jgi:hypothetical protein
MDFFKSPPERVMRNMLDCDAQAHGEPVLRHVNAAFDPGELHLPFPIICHAAAAGPAFVAAARRQICAISVR